MYIYIYIYIYSFIYVCVCVCGDLVGYKSNMFNASFVLWICRRRQSCHQTYVLDALLQKCTCVGHFLLHLSSLPWRNMCPVKHVISILFLHFGFSICASILSNSSVVISPRQAARSCGVIQYISHADHLPR